jgi:hypothetical protein
VTILQIYAPSFPPISLHQAWGSFIQSMTIRLFPRLILLSALAVPATALSLKLYLVNHPLSSSKTRSIRSTDSILPSGASSQALRSIVNPRHHIAWTNSHSIILSRSEVGDASDEEILARLVKGFFGGWIFTPEKNLLDLLHALGIPFQDAGFSSKSRDIFKI